MLAKKYRLPVQLFIKQRARILKSPYFLIRVYPASNNYSRFAVVISKKTAQKSTQRNKMKRLAYDTLSPLREKLPVFDYIINVLPQSGNLSRDEFIKKLHELII